MARVLLDASPAVGFMVNLCMKACAFTPAS